MKKLTFSEIYEKHQKSVLNQILRAVKNYHVAEELTTDVFMKLNKYPYNPKNEKGANFESWLHTITNSIIIDYFRTSRHNQNLKTDNINGLVDENGKEFFEFVAPTSTNADKDILTGETQKQIVSAFHNLKPKYRRVASMYFISGHKYSEIAKLLNIPEGTVKAMLFRARTMLQESLKVAQTV